MIITCTLRFSLRIPQPEIVLEELTNLTGLKEIYYASEGKRDFITRHNLFPKPVFSIIFDDELKEVVVWTKEPEINYLMEATVVVIKNLGGMYDFKLRDLAHKKWEDVKGVYKSRVLSMDGGGFQ
jgi:hypothetical protein